MEEKPESTNTYKQGYRDAIEDCLCLLKTKHMVRTAADDFNSEIEVPFYRELFEEIKNLGGQNMEQRWIPVTERLPEEPEENIYFEGKYLELYLVTERRAAYPFRAFWNGKNFTDGWHKLDVTAWMPLPEVYQEQAVTSYSNPGLQDFV